MVAKIVTGLVFMTMIVGCATTSVPRNSAGQVTATAMIDAYSLQVGDCISSIPADTTNQFTAIPCAEPHNWEAFARTTLDGTTFPGQKSVTDQATDFCEAAFITFVGAERAKSAYELIFLQPTADSWNSFGDHEVICLAGRSTENVTGTLEGAEFQAPASDQPKEK